ncbi:MAG: bifunctional DNase/RNase [Neolewinella sp.]|jgi:bifunctional DNase/RNase
MSKRMNKIELRVMAISRSVTQSSNYAVVLGEISGPRRLPVIIGSTEAQAIAIAIEGMEGPRPMTHDLFKNTLLTLRTELREVIISELREGVFFARLVLDREGEIIEVDSRTSDALALATRFDCPIYTYQDILESAGIELQGDDDPSEESGREMAEAASAGSDDSGEDNLSKFNVGELNNMLQEVLSNENYEKAALIRDELSRRGEN